MAFRDSYRAQVQLLIRVLPIVATERDFAIKGGTAINLFVRDMPRLSVDIDLTYLSVAPYDAALKAISGAMKRLATNIQQGIRGARVTPGGQRDGMPTKLFVDADGVRIKIEVTPVSRGAVFAPETRTVAPAVEEAFGFAENLVVSQPDLYAGKLVAALDRQHPRDLFDVRDLYAAEGIDDALRQAFVAYMLSHNRPMAEVLAPRRKNLTEPFEREFQGMTEEPVALEELVEVREKLIADIVGRMPQPHRQFMLQFERGEPDWSLLGLPDVAKLPAVTWRQQNLNKITAERRAGLVAQLEKVFEDGESAQ